MSNLTKLRALYVFAHVSLLGLFAYPPTLFLVSLSLASYFILYTVGFSIGLHRHFCHRSFEAGRGMKIVFLFLATLCCVGSPIAWAAVHRHHHRFSDTEFDPHSPSRMRLIDIWRRTYWDGINVPRASMRDLAQDPLLVFFHRRYFSIILGVMLMLLLCGPDILLYAFFIPVVAIFHVVSVGIIVVHRWGYRNFDTGDESKNSLLLSLVTFGDGWHNNHHFRPADFNHGKRFFELDVSGALIKIYCSCRSSSSKVFQEISGAKR